MTLKKQFKVSAADVDFKQRGSIERCVFYKVSRPILWVQWITGRTPWMIRSGKNLSYKSMKYKKYQHAFLTSLYFSRVTIR